MKAKRSQAYFEILFTIGLCLAVFERINLRLALLPDFVSGFLAGLSITLMLGTQLLKRRVSGDT